SDLLCLQSFTASSLHSRTASGSLRNRPLPLQGASTTSRSKKPGSRIKSFGSLLLMIPLKEPHLSICWCSTETRVLITSLLTSRESFDIRLWISVDFPPGAAQRSSTFRGLERSAAWRNACSRNIPDASCTSY